MTKQKGKTLEKEQQPEKSGALALAKKVVLGLLKDTGFGLTVSSVLLFAATNPMGLGTMLAAGAVITAIKTAQILDVDFLRRENAVTKFIQDKSTTMKILGVSGLVVAAQCLLLNPYSIPASGNLLQGAVELGKQAVPFLTATAAAVSNLMIAVQFKREEREQKAAKDRTEKGLPPLERKKTSFLKLPEPYTAAALMMRGLMAGGGSMIFLPLLAAGAGVALYNSVNNKPGYAGHPKMHYCAFNAFSGLVGLANGNILPALSALNSSAYMAVAESQITPGGFRQVVKDIRQGFVSSTERILGIAQKPEPKTQKPKVIVQPVPTEPKEYYDPFRKPALTEVNLTAVFKVLATKPEPAQPQQARIRVAVPEMKA